MALSRWIRWTLVGGCALVAVVALLVGAGLWYLSSKIAPDVEIGEALPAVSLTAFDGEPIRLESYRGQVVVLDFWSSW
jgi:cytochrome oxidase Cu insertion factor (SCO1/SenC/PrrC family)